MIQIWERLPIANKTVVDKTYDGICPEPLARGSLRRLTTKVHDARSCDLSVKIVSIQRCVADNARRLFSGSGFLPNLRIIAAICVASGSAAAQDATWLANPASGDYLSGGNWSTGSAPFGAATAFFGGSSKTFITFNSISSIAGWTFNPGASAYTFGMGGIFEFTGAGIQGGGGGIATIASDGILQFKNASSAGSSTINMSGVVQFSNTSSAGSATINNNGNLGFHDASSAGLAKINNSDLLVFGDTSTAGASSIANGRLLAFTNGSSAGQSTIVNTKTLSFDDTSNAGNARLVNTSTGVIDFSATTGAAANHVISAGSIEGAGQIFLGRNALFVGANNRSTEFSGVITDGGSAGGVGGGLLKVGTGTLTLSGQNTFTATTQISAGALIVNGALNTAASVANGSLLGGAGTIGVAAVATTVDSGGTLAPGGAGGSLKVLGNLVLETAATYLVQDSPNGLGRAEVAGNASIAGTVRALFGSDSFLTRRAAILTANGGLSGTFTGVTTNLGSNLVSLSYDANNVFLDLAKPYPNIIALNLNQRRVADALGGAFLNGGLPAALYGLSPSGLTQLSGELGTGILQPSIDASNQFLNVMLDPHIAGRGAGLELPGSRSSAYAEPGRPANSRQSSDAYAAVKTQVLTAGASSAQWSVWGSAYGGSAAIDGNAAIGSHATTNRTFGLAAGADYRTTQDLLIGFALAGGGTNFSLSERLGYGSSDLFEAGMFATQKFGSAYLSSALAYGWHDVTTNRTVTVAGIEQLQARFKADTIATRLEGGYRYASSSFGGVTPYAALQITNFNLPNYSEHSLTASNVSGLSYGAQISTAVRNELGARLDQSYALAAALLTLRSRVAWAHDYNNGRAVVATFQALPGASFVVDGAKAAPDSAMLSTGAELAWTNGVSLSGTFDGEFSNHKRSYAGKGILRYAW